jgi:cell division protein FtsB
VSLIAFIILFTFFFGDNGFIEILRKQKIIHQLKAEIEDLNNQKKELLGQIEKLKKDPYALERIAREELWLMKKNEKVIVVTKSKKKNTAGDK